MNITSKNIITRLASHAAKSQTHIDVSGTSFQLK